MWTDGRRSWAWLLGVLAGCGGGSAEFMAPGPGGADAGGVAGQGGGTGGAVIGLPDSAAPDSAGGGAGGGGGAIPAVCGDSILAAVSGEQCDDGNRNPGDGCSAACTLETGWACPKPGEPCVSTDTCPDGRLSGAEECDDGNAVDGDGCTSCKVDRGWTCPTPGARCEATRCGDGIVAGAEQCDDGGAVSGDGCSDKCKVEPGWFCPDPGAPCKRTVCGNGVVEGDEGCDDGGTQPWDGCSPTCQPEPTCTNGACSSTCGDGMILAGDVEECDDGNRTDGDGCSATCTKEQGWTCTVVPETLPDELVLPVVYRDVISLPTGAGVRHPDFQIFSGDDPTLNLVKTALGTDGKPAYNDRCDDTHNSACPYGQQLTTKANFDQWYRDVPGVNVRGDATLTLTKNASGQYSFDGGNGFTPFSMVGGPLENVGWVALGQESLSNGKNFGFTTEFHYWFQLKGNEHLDFSGDDDVWVFINARLLIDLGGLHPKRSASIDLTDAEITQLGMTKDRIYEIAFFHAERHTAESNFKLTMNGFVRSRTSCQSVCGDGIVVGNEVCDDGANNGKYGYCKTDCSGRGPHCGDAVVQADQGEECDDGVNLSPYGFNGVRACAPGCKWSDYCGDQKTDSLFGEQCDDGNDIPGDGCEPNCTNRARCGNGAIDEADGETCDDGNTVSGDGCSEFCTTEIDVH